MKQLLLTTVIAFSTLSAPVMAMSIDTSSITPVLTFPEPAPDPVTQDTSGIDAQ